MRSVAFILIGLAMGLTAMGLTMSPAHGQPTVVHVGQLIAVPGDEPRRDVSVVISDTRIERIEDGFIDVSTLGQDAVLIDLSTHTVLPGLMDMHVHLRGELSGNSRNEALYTNETDMTLRAAHHARTTLNAGFTTVRDLGAPPAVIYSLRKGIEQGWVEGPRLFAAGSALAATGGHGDVDGYRAELLALWTPDTICDGADDCRRATRRAIKYGADWIKITATGGVLSDTATGTGQQMTDEELRAIVDTAHALGVKVAAHAHGADGINAALAAGVDTIDHGTFLDDESIRRFKRTGAYLVPTLMPGHLVPAMMEGNPFFTAAIRAKADAASAASKANFRKALEAGVTIAFGTDSGVTPHGRNALEFELMVAEGMSPADAIGSATVTTAELLGIADDLGTVEPGKLADLIAVRGDPLEDIAELRRVVWVMKDGRVFANRVVDSR